MLIALDRAVAKADPTWADFLVRAVVDFAVWTARPTGYIDQDGGRWLRFGTGAGITWGSDPGQEWAETELKAARLVGLASGRVRV